MNKKIYGVTVGTPLPKPNLAQKNPSMGDYVYGKEEFLKEINGVSSWNDLTDKPFGDGTVYYEWNEETEYQDVVPVPEEEGVESDFSQFAKISSDAPASDFFIGKTLVQTGVAVDGPYSDARVVTEADIYPEADGLYMVGMMNGFTVCTVDSFTVGGMTLTRGIWCMDGMTSGAAPTCVKLIDATTLLDEKYIPDTIARTSQIPEIPVTSVNGMTGNVVIDIPEIPAPPVTSVNGMTGDVKIEIPEPSVGVSSWNELEDRPFWENVTVNSHGVVYLDKTLEFTAEGDVYTSESVGLGVNFLEGHDYCFIWDGTEYHLTAQGDGTSTLSSGLVWAGNGSIVDSELPDTGEPFYVTRADNYGSMNRLIVFKTADESAAHTVKASSVSITRELKQLDEKFIPDTIARTANAIPVPATASVGQTIVVKSVDENGKPTEWEAVDMPSGGGGETSAFESIADITTEEVVQTLEFPFTNQNVNEIFVFVKPSSSFSPANTWFRIAGESKLVFNFAHINSFKIGTSGMFVNAKFAGEMVFSTLYVKTDYMWNSDKQYASEYERDKTAGDITKIMLEFYADVPVGTVIRVFAR